MWDSFNFGNRNKNICFEMKGFVRAGQRRYGSANGSRGDWWVAASLKGGSQSNLSCYLRRPGRWVEKASDWLTCVEGKGGLSGMSVNK